MRLSGVSPKRESPATLRRRGIVSCGARDHFFENGRVAIDLGASVENRTVERCRHSPHGEEPMTNIFGKRYVNRQESLPSGGL
jgi:hypothetical protein